jgi:eukaryotic-like serine/threonine-protein kinase
VFSPAMLAPADLDDIFVGQYRIDRDVRRGGMATVYRARDLKHHRDVVIKVRRPDVISELTADRFTRESCIG